jgi:hypothetical protein
MPVKTAKPKAKKEAFTQATPKPKMKAPVSSDRSEGRRRNRLPAHSS